VWQESHKGNHGRSEIKDFEDNKFRSRGQTKDFRMGRYLNGLYNRNSGLRIVYIW
jgi:hypothetical protein